MELAEVYRYIYEVGPDDMLRGTIVCKDETNGHQILFNEKGLGEDRDDNDNNQPLIITSLDHIIPNVPTKASIRAKNGFSIYFDLFEVISDEISIEYPHGRHYMLSCPRRADLLSRDGTRYLSILYAIYENAVEARINVTLTNNGDPFHLYGVIAARTSAIDERAYSSLIFLKEHGEKIQVGNGDNIVIPFSRRIVAVPLQSHLVLEFSLNVPDNDKEVEDGNANIVEEIMVFDAKRDEIDRAYISCSKGLFKVEVKWMSM